MRKGEAEAPDHRVRCQLGTKVGRAIESDPDRQGGSVGSRTMDSTQGKKLGGPQQTDALGQQ